MEEGNQVDIEVSKPKSLKILHIKRSNLAKAPDQLVNMINKYTGHTAHLQNKPNINYDVIHYHNVYLPPPKLDKNTKYFIQYHSEPFRTNPKKLKSPCVPLVIAQYHATMPDYDQCHIVRNIIDIESPAYKFKQTDLDTPIRIGYSPSVTRKVNVFYDKGYTQTRLILEKLKEELKIEFDIITGVSLDTCIQRKSECDIIIDECVTGSYHRSGLEGLGLGKMTVCWLKPEVEFVFKKSSGSETCPFENIRIDGLEDFLRMSIQKGKQHILDIGKRNREWMEKYWHPKDIVQEIIDMYQGYNHLQYAGNPEISKLYNETVEELIKNPPNLLEKKTVKVVPKSNKTEIIAKPKVVPKPNKTEITVKPKIVPVVVQNKNKESIHKDLYNRYFDKIFIVNLDERKDRWEETLKELKNLGITNFERFSAIRPDIKKVPVEFYNKLVSPHKAKPKYQTGAVGCKMSHYEIIKLAKKRNYKRILILEDDIEFNSFSETEIKNRQKNKDKRYKIDKTKEDWARHFKIINNAMSDIPQDWEMIYFGANYKKQPKQVNPKNPNLFKINAALTTHSYAIQSNVFDKCIDNMLNSGLEIDNFYIKNIHEPVKSKCYCIKPGLIRQRESYSDVVGRVTDYLVIS